MNFVSRVITAIATVVCIISFIVFLVDLFNRENFNFGIPAIIIFGVCFVIFLFSKNKKNAFVDIWTVLEIIFDFFT